VSASGPPIDHDRFFKELLSTFFLEFLDLFFPKLASSIDRESLEFLNQELYVNQLDGEQYRADLIAKARYLHQHDAFFLVHVEHQSTAPPDFNRRFCQYFYSIFDRHGVPVFPIVIYSHNKPRKKQPDRFLIDFPGRRVLAFHYSVVQLNRLPWRRFVNSLNPVASALMSKMKIAPRDRPRVKLECIRLLVTLKLNPAKMRLIGRFVDAYLRLNPEEDRRFFRALDESGMPPEQEKVMLDYVTSWEEKGIEKGIQQGIEQGIEQGRQQGIREVLLDLLATRFGALDPALVAKVHAVTSVEDLRRLTHQALTATSLAELDLPAEPQVKPRPKRTRKTATSRAR